MSSGSKPELLVRLGVWGWGATTAVLCGYLVYRILFTGWALPEESGSVLGAIVAANVLAWSYFYQTANKVRDDVDEKLDRILSHLERGTVSGS